MNQVEERRVAHIPMLTHSELGSIDVAVIDMDGTIYKNKPDEMMTSSVMNEEYYRCARQFIRERENVSESAVNEILRIVTGDGGGVSAGLSFRYKTTRQEVRNNVWGGMRASWVIGEFIPQARAVRALAAQGKTLILLTSAPRVWRERAMSYVGLTGVFNLELDADSYPDKTEAFRDLAQKFDPARTVSIGNQIETDILPAHAVGMRAYLVVPSWTLPDLVFGK